jgi:hypothetical protein
VLIGKLLNRGRDSWDFRKYSAREAAVDDGGLDLSDPGNLPTVMFNRAASASLHGSVAFNVSDEDLIAPIEIEWNAARN